MSLAEIQTQFDGRALDQQKPQAESLSSMALDFMKGASAGAFKAADSVGAMFGNLELVSARKGDDLGFRLPAEAESALKELGVTGMSRDGNHLTMTLRGAVEKEYPGAPKMWLDKNVTADVELGNNTIELKNINGMMAGFGPAWANIQNAKFEKRDGKCYATVTAGRFLLSHDEKMELPVELFDQLQKSLKDNGF